jgi:hypothetical protein
MRKLWITILLTAGLLVGLGLSARGDCGVRPCSPLPCTKSRDCGYKSGCVCMKQGFDLTGVCVSFERGER